MAESVKADLGRAGRGVQYPADSLEVALEILTRVRNAIGFGAASRETIVESLGYKGITGSSARKIAVLTHFGLIERVGGGAYKISELGKRLLIPTRPEERTQSIVEAAKRPTLYSELFERYKDSALPPLLANLLAREHGVFPTSADAAARSFRETMEYAGLLRNGVLRAEPVDEKSHYDDRDGPHKVAADVTTPASPTSAPVFNPVHPSPVSAAPGVQTYTIPLDSTGRVATIQIPIPMTARDLKKFGSWVTFMSNVIEDEETPDISSN